MVQDECVRLAYEAGVLRVVGYLYDTVDLMETTDKILESWRIADASSFFPWAAAVGKTVRWAWTLENQQGYLDALQLELADTKRGGFVGIQLVAMASHLVVHSVLPVETPYLAPPTAD